jgi:hypothetical protein
MNSKKTFSLLISTLIVTGLGIVIVIMEACQSNNIPDGYKGRPFSDAQYSGGAQNLPGKLQCEYYDSGGEGVAFYDADTINSGSGGLNPADGTYLNEFRKNEAVDISYTKFRDPAIDNTPYNFVETEKDQLYVGWTKPGEWVKYSVNFTKAGTYKLGLMYTSNKNGKISISLNDKDVTGPVLIPSTFVEADSVAWRQWHHWNYLGGFSTIEIKKGLQTVTLHTADVGDMNYDYIDFELVR